MQAKRVLHRLLDDTCDLMHEARRVSLAANVMAALSGTRLTVTGLGRSMESRAKTRHCIKRSDRLLSNRHLHRERLGLYTTLTRLLIGDKQRPFIIVDWSDMDASKRHFLLRASVPVAGRSLTLYEEVHTNATKEKPKTHLAFLRTLQAMLPGTCRPIVVSDAGFRVPWFRWVESFGWDWVGRVRNRTYIRQAGKRKWVLCKSLYREATGTPKALGEVCMARSNPMTCQFVLYKGKPKGRLHKNRQGKRSRTTESRRQAAKGREPWLSATSLAPSSTLANKVVGFYKLRMQIKEAFRDLKSSRFGLSLEQHLSYQVQRLQIMLLIAALALMVAWLMGKATELTKQHWQYQANSIRNRLVLSTIFIGMQVICDTRVTLKAEHLKQAFKMLAEIIQGQCIDD